MLQSAIVRVTDICTRHPWYVIALALALSAFSTGYTERHFAIKTTKSSRRICPGPNG
jgi:hypothetical protein